MYVQKFYKTYDCLFEWSPIFIYQVLLVPVEMFPGDIMPE